MTSCSHTRRRRPQRRPSHPLALRGRATPRRPRCLLPTSWGARASRAGTALPSRNRRERAAAPRESSWLWALWLLVVCLASATVSCLDPVQRDRRASLGGEQPGVPRGPTHRPGQPCTWCHDGSYKFEIAVAGTVYTTLDGTRPVEGARVKLTDAAGRTVELTSNCAGTFYVEPSNWAPAYPLRASVSFGGETQEMKTPIEREGSCAACHQKSVSTSSPGPVFMFKGAVPSDVPGGCP
jgi:hypothetical protein